MESAAFIMPIKAWDSMENISTVKKAGTVNNEPSLFQNIFNNAVEQVTESQKDVETKQYLLATGQLDDAHSLPIAEAKASLNLEVLISLRNKAMESYSELMKMSI